MSGDCAAMRLDKIANDRQSDPKAATANRHCTLILYEQIKDARQCRRRDANAVVGDTDCHHIV